MWIYIYIYTHTYYVGSNLRLLRNWQVSVSWGAARVGWSNNVHVHMHMYWWSAFSFARRFDATLKGGEPLCTHAQVLDARRFSLALVRKLHSTLFDILLHLHTYLMLRYLLLDAMLFGLLKFLHTTSHVGTTSQWIKRTVSGIRTNQGTAWTWQFQNGWFTWENPIIMDDLRWPLF